jgi:hypothetical protein
MIGWLLSYVNTTNCWKKYVAFAGPHYQYLLSGAMYTFIGHLKGLSHEIDFKNVVENGQILALIRAAAGFLIFRRHL